MKRYTAPVVRFNNVSHKHEIIATSLQIWDEVEADPDEPILIRKRDQDWDAWD